MLLETQRHTYITWYLSFAACFDRYYGSMEHWVMTKASFRNNIGQKEAAKKRLLAVQSAFCQLTLPSCSVLNFLMQIDVRSPAYQLIEGILVDHVALRNFPRNSFGVKAGVTQRQSLTPTS